MAAVRRTHDEIRAKFAELRETCDPRGHALLDQLENACLVDNAMLALNDRVRELELEIAYPEFVPQDRPSLRLIGGDR